MKSILGAGVAFMLVASIGCEAPVERSKLPGYSKAPISNATGRPKMLTMNDGDASGNCFGQTLFPFESAAQANAISITNAEDFIGGSPRSCISVNMPDASQDEKLLEMYAGFKTMAIPVLLNLSLQTRNAVIVDLRSNPTAQYKRVEYEVSGPGFTLPVVVKWDVNASGRLMNLLTKAKELPGISISQTAEDYNF